MTTPAFKKIQETEAMNKIEEKTREQIATFLPEALNKALSSYQDFASGHNTGSQKTKTDDVPQDAKAFKDHHDACKVAIAHIQLLIKLAEWANLPDPGVGTHNDQIRMMMLMQEGKNTLEEDREQYGEEED